MKLSTVCRAACLRRPQHEDREVLDLVFGELRRILRSECEVEPPLEDVCDGELAQVDFSWVVIAIVPAVFGLEADERFGEGFTLAEMEMIRLE